jgi:putative MATE family efflux protein
LLNSTASPEKKSLVHRDWTQGSIVQNLLLLSWPVMILGALYAVNLILEMVWVGRLGPTSIAGVGVAGFVVILVVSIKNGFGAGERAMVARYIGAGEVAAANKVAAQAFIISASYAIVIAVIGVLLTRPLFGLFHLEPDATAQGVTYLRILLGGWITEAIWMTSFAVMQASGDSISPLKAAIVLRVVNAVLCPFLVLGIWIFPRLGVSGAAITYISATALGAGIALFFLFSGKTRLKLSLRDFYPDPQIIRRILKIGFPASISGLGIAFGNLILTSIMIPFGTVALAAHNLLSRIELFVNTPGMGLGTAAGVLVGQNLGARKPGQATKSGWVATVLVFGIMLIFAVILLVWAENVIRLFTVEPELVKTGASFVRIAVAGYLGMCVVNALQSSISGAGDTLVPMLISLATMWLVQLPLAYVFTRYTQVGVFGVRWAIVISFTVGALAYAVYFQRGRWKRKKF